MHGQSLVIGAEHAVREKVTAGKLPQGVVLDPDTGLISARPVQDAVHKGLRIAVQTTDGGSSESKPFTFTVMPESVGISFAAVDLRLGQSFKTAGPSFDKGVILPYEFKKAAGVDISEELDVDYANAIVSGKPTAAGNYDVPFAFVNGNGFEQVFTQPIEVHAPLAINYADTTAAYRRTPISILPTSVEGVVGTETFSFSSGKLPLGLSVDPATGAVNGSPTQMG